MYWLYDLHPKSTFTLLSPSFYILSSNVTAWETVCESCWCGHKPSNQKLLGVHSLEDCKQKCIDSSDCKAIEFWAGLSFCFNLRIKFHRCVSIIYRTD